MRELLFIACAFFFGLVFGFSAVAEERNPLYRDTVPGTEVPCCNKQDCHPVRYRMVPGGEYEIYLPMGYWYRPEKRIIRVQFIPDGEAHACWTADLAANYSANRITVFCVWIPIQFM